MAVWPVFLVNTNVARPPVSPVGLEYVAEALIEAGVPVRALDLTFESDWKARLRGEFEQYEPLAVGLSVRNTDDCCCASRKSFLPWIREVVLEVRRLADSPIFLGGGGFSVGPEGVLSFTGADLAITVDGGAAQVALARPMGEGQNCGRLLNTD